MEHPEFTIRFSRPSDRDVLDMRMWRRHYHKFDVACPVQVEFKSAHELEAPEPFISIAGCYSKEFMTALTEAVREYHGTLGYNDIDLVDNGVIGAQLRHLEDLQRVLKIHRRKK